MKKSDLTIVPATTGSSDGSIEEKIDDLTIDGSLPDDEDPKPPSSGGGAARPVPQPVEEQWLKSLTAFETAAEDLSRAARHVQMIRLPLESLARDIATMTREIGGMREEMAQLRQNLMPPIAVEPVAKSPVPIRHDGPIAAWIKPPSVSLRAKSIAWHAARAVIGALAAWGALHVVGSFWPGVVLVVGSWLW